MAHVTDVEAGFIWGMKYATGYTIKDPKQGMAARPMADLLNQWRKDKLYSRTGSGNEAQVTTYKPVQRVVNMQTHKNVGKDMTQVRITL